MTHPVMSGYGMNNLVVTYGYGRDTLEGGTQITQLYREFNFSFDISFEIKEKTELDIIYKVAFDSTDTFELFSQVPIAAKTEFELAQSIRVSQDNIYSIESKTSKEVSFNFEVTSVLSHKKLIRMLDLMEI